MALKSARAKGKQGELEICHVLRERFGWTARRSAPMQAGHGGFADIEVEQTPDVFYEIKRVQNLCVPRALSIAAQQAGRRCPVLLHRPNRSSNGWMLTIRLDDLPRLCHAYTHATQE